MSRHVLPTWKMVHFLWYCYLHMFLYVKITWLHIKAKENSQSKEAQLCRKPPNLATLFPPEVTQKSSMRDLIILSEIHTHTHTHSSSLTFLMESEWWDWAVWPFRPDSSSSSQTHFSSELWTAFKLWSSSAYRRSCQTVICWLWIISQHWDWSDGLVLYSGLHH